MKSKIFDKIIKYNYLNPVKRDNVVHESRDDRCFGTSQTVICNKK